ncbi:MULTISPECIES: hypothetical protein [unclassified Kitasatospora]|uniref:hypothetical protein n=1 Tax=unclassified Kitasatospora TaxID=2633591 RepID=UPI003826AF17
MPTCPVPRHGDAWLKGALGIAVATAVRGTGTYLAAWYRHLVAHRGKNGVLVAVGHSILIAT